MQRSGTYWSFFLMGAFSEILLLLTLMWLLQIPIITTFALNVMLAGVLYVGYRYIMDWNYFSNSVSREAREYVIRKTGINQLIFAGVCAILLVFSNINLLEALPIMTLWAFGFVAAIISFNVVDAFRELALYLNASEEKTEFDNPKPCFRQEV